MLSPLRLGLRAGALSDNSSDNCAVDIVSADDSFISP